MAYFQDKQHARNAHFLFTTTAIFYLGIGIHFFFRMLVIDSHLKESSLQSLNASFQESVIDIYLNDNKNFFWFCGSVDYDIVLRCLSDTMATPN